jgi:uncharacterized RDD family membrane protein YckC
MEKTIVDKGVRFQNFLIDISTILIIYATVILILRPEGLLEYAVFHCVYFLYYFIMELKYGQTLGKRFTKTLVINIEGGQVNYKELFIRTAFRFVALNILSYLMGNHVGMHDWFSNTRVVKVGNSQLK